MKIKDYDIVTVIAFVCIVILIHNFLKVMLPMWFLADWFYYTVIIALLVLPICLGYLWKSIKKNNVEYVQFVGKKYTLPIDKK